MMNQKFNFKEIMQDSVQAFLQSLEKQNELFLDRFNQMERRFLQLIEILTPKDESPTFGEMAKDYLEGKPNLTKCFRSKLENTLIPKLGRKTLKQINRRAIVTFLGEELIEIRKRIKDRMQNQKRDKRQFNEISGNNTINQLKTVISVVFSHAIGLGFFEGHNPTQDIKNKEVDPRRVYADDEIYQQLMFACPEQHQKTMLKLCFLTAQRPSDVLKMQWSDIVDGCLRVYQGKTKKKLQIKIEGQLKVLIDSLSKEKKPLHHR